MTENDLKKVIYKKNNQVDYLISPDGIVTIVRQQNHPIQKFFRKLGIKIPHRTYLELDEYGSFIFKNIDGKTNVYDLGKKLSDKFKGSRDMLYTRLVIYLQNIEKNEKLIVNCSQETKGGEKDG